MLASLALAAPSTAADNWRVFEGTESPSHRFAVAWAKTGVDLNTTTVDASEANVNYLVDLKAHKIVTKLIGWEAFPGENHGGLKAAYSPGEKVVAIVHENKWEPRGLVLVVTQTGKVTDCLDKVQRDAKRYFKRSNFVIDVAKIAFTKSTVKFNLLAQVPISEDPGSYVESTYPLKVSKQGVKLGKVKFYRAPKEPAWVTGG